MNNNSIPQTINQQIDDLLNRIAESLQLDDTRRESAERSYRSVSDWISTDTGFFKDVPFDIYPQGSFRIGTTVKPFSGSEFDLDIVLHFEGPYERFNPISTLNEIVRRLKENGTYAPMVERKNRCIRLNYANEFHMDILPGFYEANHDNNRIMVPDRILKDWTPSNPRGYAQWFETKYVKEDLLLLEKARSVEKLPDNIPYQFKQPLQQAVQLIKRYRDVYFQDKPELATSSIILTTLAATFYSGQTSEYQAIRSIIDGINRAVPLLQGQVLEIVNPANPAEKFSDKWEKEPELYKAFVSFSRDFKKLWDQLHSPAGIHKAVEIIKPAFGDTVSLSALREQVLYVEKARNSGSIGLVRNTGLLTGASGVSITNIGRNNFYGG
ncbi:nucleotidyltransferase [Adhaeribacter sp. BT258]|uniref:Nucleotidyltransferase n=1 Tax=Adhaeribacter terrigena TaxID=2793070 RepID=A0ABS1C112_9BACT|nr:nucleotidyltransferase [Adhaeribacter terrigena]MBK0403052.1 nucleotidyltransferase [Adhaeribacter terrigena]